LLLGRGVRVGSQISCAVTNPPGIFTCDSLQAPISESCPADAELLRAFLKNTGTASVFLIIDCDKSEYVAQLVEPGQLAQLNTRASDVCEEATATVYDSDPLDGGSSIGSSQLQIACPGPWTLGATIAPGFVLESYVSTFDNGGTFDFNIAEVEVEINYIGQNAGSVPLTISDGTITSPLGSGPVTGLPTNIAVRNQQILQTQVGTIELSGKDGQALTFIQSLNGVGGVGTCEGTSELVINL